MKKAIIFAFAFLFCAIICTTDVSAATVDGYPEFPVTEGQYNEYILRDTDGLVYLHHFTSTEKFTFEFRPSNFDVNSPNAGFTETRYQKTGSTWKQIRTDTYQKGTTNIGGISVNFNYWVYSSQDVVNSSTGEVVFQGPLAPEEPLEKMLKTEIPKMAEKVVAAMRILLLCGVGCLALLMALPTLSKVLSTFLGR